MSLSECCPVSLPVGKCSFLRWMGRLLVCANWWEHFFRALFHRFDFAHLDRHNLAVLWIMFEIRIKVSSLIFSISGSSWFVFISVKFQLLVIVCFSEYKFLWPPSHGGSSWTLAWHLFISFYLKKNWNNFAKKKKNSAFFYFFAFLNWVNFCL